MGTPTTDRAAVSQIIQGLTSNGVRLDFVYDQEDEVPTPTKEKALDAIFAVDMSHLNVTLPNGRTGWVWFVLGNDPEEVAADYTENLSPYIETVTDRW